MKRCASQAFIEGNKMVDMVLRLTTLAVDLLGSPVEIHVAGGRRESLRLVREGCSGDMLTARRQDSSRELRAQAEARPAAWGSFSPGWTAEVML